MHRLPTGVTRQKLLREGSYQAAAAIASASSRRTRITRCNMQAAVRGNYGVRRRGRPPYVLYADDSCVSLGGMGLYPVIAYNCVHRQLLKAAS